MKSFTIGHNDAGQRVDKFIKKAVPALPSSLMQRYIRIKRIKLNGKRCENNTVLSQGDFLELYINDEFFAEEAADDVFMHIKGKIEIVYEDAHLLLVNKQPGLVVHEDDTKTADTLINRVKLYLHQKGEYDPKQENSFAPALCNRIDRNTGGIVIAAKDAPTLRVINQLIKDRMIEKYYLCAVHGRIDPPHDTITAYLAKDENTNTVTVYRRPRSDTKTIITKYKTLKTNEKYSLLEVELLTGRTHQIRAHMAFIGHPLVGDTKYGHARDNQDTGYKYQALYSYKLTFKPDADSAHLHYLNGKTFTLKDPPSFDPIF